MGKYTLTCSTVLYDSLEAIINIKNIQIQKIDFFRTIFPEKECWNTLAVLICYKPLHFKLEANLYLTADRKKLKNTNPRASQSIKH